MSLDDYTIIGLAAYEGKKGCQDARCRHWFIDGKMSEDCIGWHCAHCDEPCSSQGHRCPALASTREGP